MQVDEDKIYIYANPPYNVQIPIVEYRGNPKNLYEFCESLLKKANKTFGTLYHISENLKKNPFTSPETDLFLRFTSEDDMIRFLRNFTYISKMNRKYYIVPKETKSKLL